MAKKHTPNWVSRKKFMEICGGMNRQTLSEAIKNGIVEEGEKHLIDSRLPINARYITERLKKVDAERIAAQKEHLEELAEVKLETAKEELRAKQIKREEMEGKLYPVKRFLHMKETYFTNAPKRVNQEHRNWFRIVAKKFGIAEKDRLALDKEFGELINKTYSDELDALEAEMKKYQDELGSV